MLSTRPDNIPSLKHYFECTFRYLHRVRLDNFCPLTVGPDNNVPFNNIFIQFHGPIYQGNKRI